jgi:pyridine nucleotide-disulfide oxidoreductase family protein
MTKLVLAGAGHAHAQVLLEFGRSRPSGLRQLILVSPHALAPYSGMVPGWMAGFYRWEECCIDFRALCRHAGATFIQSEISAINPSSSTLMLEDGRQLRYDWLSLNVGSTLKPAGNSTHLLPVRPLQRLHDGWTGLLRSLREREPEAPFRLVMVGGGAAAVETMLALHHAIHHAAHHAIFPSFSPAASSRGAEFVLATSGSKLVSGLSPRAAQMLAESLKRASIRVIYDFDALSADNGVAHARDGRDIAAEAVLWATGAEPHDWLADSGLATDNRGFVSIDPTLRSVSHPKVFATGDCAGFTPPLPKAGVYAVRMGRVLARNLRAVIEGKKLAVFKPQRRYLVLVETGDERAVASWGPLAVKGRLVWRWKQHIDRRFLRKYAV